MGPLVECMQRLFDGHKVDGCETVSTRQTETETKKNKENKERKKIGVLS